MSWLFSKALLQAYENSRSSRALAEEYSAATSSDGAPSAPLSVMPTQHKFWRSDKTMEPSQLSRFGLTCAVLTEDHGEALLTWFRADSRVRTYPLPGLVPGLTASALASGVKWLESSVKYDPDTSSWKTHRCLWEEDLPWSSVNLPKWGMALNGLVYRHPTLERPISATESGLWPTPTVHGNHNMPGSSKTAGWGLSSAVKMWPTPNACKASNDTTLRKSGDGRDRPNKLGWAVSENAENPSEPGPLNPAWVEWLMGWPIGWTDLKPLEMAKFHEWQQQHSPFSIEADNAA